MENLYFLHTMLVMHDAVWKERDCQVSYASFDWMEASTALTSLAENWRYTH